MTRDEIEKIAALLKSFGTDGDEDALAQAREWIAEGFDESSEVEDWLKADCTSPRAARLLDDAGLTPEQAAISTRAGAGEYEGTIGRKFARGDLTLPEARRIATSDFWGE